MNLAYVFEHGDIILIGTFLLLISMSVISWYIIFWKFISVRIENNRINSFKKEYMTSPDWHNSIQNVKVKGLLGMLLKEYQKNSHSNFAMHISQSLDNIRVSLDRGLTILASIGSSAPFIGLFGTVWGIYGALMDISVQGNASLNVVAGPMGEALIATAVGLFAAIPAVLAYNAFVRCNRLLIQNLRHISEQLTVKKV